MTFASARYMAAWWRQHKGLPLQTYYGNHGRCSVLSYWEVFEQVFVLLRKVVVRTVRSKLKCICLYSLYKIPSNIRLHQNRFTSSQNILCLRTDRQDDISPLRSYNGSLQSWIEARFISLGSIPIIMLLKMRQTRYNNSHLSQFVLGSRGSSVSIVSGYVLDDRAIKVRSPTETREFFL
jgi:hypothetical protein